MWKSLRPYTRSPVARVRGSMLLRAVSQASVRNKVESKMTDMTTTRDRETARDPAGPPDVVRGGRARPRPGAAPASRFVERENSLLR